MEQRAGAVLAHCRIGCPPNLPGLPLTSLRLLQCYDLLEGALGDEWLYVCTSIGSALPLGVLR